MDEARIIAWIDGTLSPEEARAVAAAVAADPALAARADQHRRIKARYQKAFGGLIAEAARMPGKTRAAGEVVSLAAVRARRDAQAPAARTGLRAGGRHWLLPAGIAASLLVGIATGLQVRPLPGVSDQPHAMTLDRSLSRALETAPSGAAGAVRIAQSFRDRTGHWCRSFAATDVAGIACRGQDLWRLRYAAAGDPAEQQRVTAAIAAGAPADAAAERAAIAAGWR